MQPLVICSFCIISFRKRLGCACEVLVPNLCHSPHRLENFLPGRDVEIVHSFGISHSAWSGPTGPLAHVISDFLSSRLLCEF